MRLDLNKLATLFDEATWARGVDCQRQGRVVSLRRDGDRLQGLVKSSRGYSYATDVTVLRDRGAVSAVHGDCGCPVGINCKHVVALLIQAARHLQLANDVDPGVEYWLQRLDSVLQAKAAGEERVIYLLDVNAEGRLAVYPLRQRKRKNGTWGKPYGVPHEHDAQRLQQQDRALLRQLWAQDYGGEIRLRPEWGAELLPALLATGRCHWRAPDAPPLRLGASRPGVFVWEDVADGSQRLVLRVEWAQRLLPLTPPWYLDGDECGPVDTGLDPAVTALLLEAPTVRPESADALADGLARLSLPVPPPRTLVTRRLGRLTPVPCLRLEAGQRDRFHDAYAPSAWAVLSFRYDGWQVDADQPGTTVSEAHGTELVRFERDPQAEADASRQLARAGLRLLRAGRHGHWWLWREDEWLRFMQQEVPRLRAAGWQIEIADDFPFRLAEGGELQVRIDETPESDWFELALGIEVDGESVDLLPALLRYLETRGAKDPDTVTVPLPDGRLLPLPSARRKPILDTLQALYLADAVDGTGRLKLARADSHMLLELESAGVRWLGGDGLRRLGERLRQGVAPAPQPKGLTVALRDYQRQGVGWLQMLAEAGFGGVLADDMGLGKTVQILAHLLLEKEAGRADRPSLVIAPTSVIGNWRREAARFAPELKVLTLHGPDRAELVARIPAHDLVLSTYPLLPRDEDAFLAHEYHLLVLDEAQYIKNPLAKAAETARKLTARQRLCLTGTPLENHLGELWSLFHFLMPGFLGGVRHFRQTFRNPIERDGNEARRQQLARRIAPFLLRRTKEAVVRELPPKTEIVQTVELSGAQRDLYETVRVAMLERVREELARRGLKSSHIVILDALLKLRQVCCDPRLVKLPAAARVKRSAKLELLMELLPEMLAEGRRVLLFSQFTAMLELIEEALRERGIDYLKLTGQTRDRATPIERFQRGEVPLFLISLKAGGTGLNLTAADTVIHYDPWWNPAVERQATDRAYRIGQDKPVFVYKLLTAGTVEEKIAELQARKQGLSDAVLGGAEQAAAEFGEAELRELFAPLA